MRVSFPASAYCMVMKAFWLVVVKQPSLGVGVICVRACESERESTPAMVIFGVLWAVCQHPPGWTNVLCVCVQRESV